MDDEVADFDSGGENQLALERTVSAVALEDRGVVRDVIAILAVGSKQPEVSRRIDRWYRPGPGSALEK